MSGAAEIAIKRQTLANAIELSGLTRVEIARRLGVSAASITLWAQGRRLMMEPVAVAFAKLLGVKRSKLKLKTRKAFACLTDETTLRRRA